MKRKVILAMILTLTTLGCTNETIGPDPVESNQVSSGSSSRLLHDAEAVASAYIQVMNKQGSQ